MRYLLDYRGPTMAQRWIVDIVADRQRGYRTIHARADSADLPPRQTPIGWATMRLDESDSDVNYFGDHDYRLEPLPLGEHRLLSPLDFRPGYYDD